GLSLHAVKEKPTTTEYDEHDERDYNDLRHLTAFGVVFGEERIAGFRQCGRDNGGVFDHDTSGIRVAAVGAFRHLGRGDSPRPAHHPGQHFVGRGASRCFGGLGRHWRVVAATHGRRRHRRPISYFGSRGHGLDRRRAWSRSGRSIFEGWRSPVARLL